uniref:hypothetical protein n=1 Tax=Ningiella ruwaisensis TaxID=2364274 RepID=UPI00109F3538|nr:hypothetical protein [Ningiella ruwaisensis]
MTEENNASTQHNYQDETLAPKIETRNENSSEVSASPSSMKKYVIASVWLVVIAVLILVVFRSQQAQEQRNQVEETVNWDPRLASCNKIVDANPNEDFTRCLEMADEGWVEAAQKIAWAYSRDGEYQNWQEAYNWLVWLKDYDENAELLSYIVLFEIGESQDAKINGERGIRHMAVTNQPAAAAYLAAMYFLDLNYLPQRSNTLWLLERAFKRSNYWLMPEELATIYSQGYLGDKAPKRAKSILLDAAQTDFPFNANNIAWLFATTADPELQDPEQALQLAQEVVADEAHANNYVYVDTLAAAYAAKGDFTKAVETQEKALALIEQAYIDADAPSDELEGFKERLAMFKAGKAYTAGEIVRSGQAFFDELKKNIEQALIESLYNEIQAPELPTQTTNN